MQKLLAFLQGEDYDAGEQKIPAFPAGKQERKEEYVMDINAILEAIDGAVWGVPLIVLLIACGVWLTFRVRFLQVRHLGKALKFMVKNEEGGEGEVTSFGALYRPLRHHRHRQHRRRGLRHCRRWPRRSVLDAGRSLLRHGHQVFRGSAGHQVS